MSKHGTKIEWTHMPGFKGETWNPTVGCAKYSAGCRDCYAMKMAARIVAMGGGASDTYRKVLRDCPRCNGAGVLGDDIDNPAGARLVPCDQCATIKKWDAGLGVLPQWNGSALFLRERLEQPLRWRKPRCVFVDSMSDLFHEDITNEQIAAVFGVMAACPQHRFLVLTKRASRLPEWFRWLDEGQLNSSGRPPSWYPFGVELAKYGIGMSEEVRRAVASHPAHQNRARDLYWPLPNVWLGVSVENQDTANERLPHLLKAPAAKRFVSYEPAIGPIDWDRTPWFYSGYTEPPYDDVISWVIVGGESGPGARPFDLQWARDTVEECHAAGTACFVKQIGANSLDAGYCPQCNGLGHPGVHGVECRFCEGAGVILEPLDLRHRKGADPSEWPEDLRVQQWPEGGPA